ncbi:hypothetical protein IMZ48_31170 [Candidatus Bathyarchaeota archaeon]|nr:hypothetical protein [Candidatus Bathyarchaeota archaeon]
MAERTQDVQVWNMLYYQRPRSQAYCRSRRQSRRPTSRDSAARRPISSSPAASNGYVKSVSPWFYLLY